VQSAAEHLCRQAIPSRFRSLAAARRNTFVYKELLKHALSLGLLSQVQQRPCPPRAATRGLLAAQLHAVGTELRHDSQLATECVNVGLESPELSVREVAAFQLGAATALGGAARFTPTRQFP